MIVYKLFFCLSVFIDAANNEDISFKSDDKELNISSVIISLSTKSSSQYAVSSASFKAICSL